MQILPLILLADKYCSTTRAYILYMASCGYAFKKILALDFIGHGSRTILAERLFGRRVAFGLFNLYRWRLRRQEQSLTFIQMCSELQESFKIKIDYFAPFSYENYSEQVENIIIRDFSDEALPALLLKQPAHTFLYTGGGIVPGSLLTIPDVRILHIHPGVVPDVKGSDGLLWSLTVRGCPGASCFFMNSGIDTGDIIAVKEFPTPSFNLSMQSIDWDIFYNAMLYAYDPHLRASLLLDVLQENQDRSDLKTIPSHSQEPGSGRTFFTMHQKIKNKVMYQLVKRR